MIYLLDSSAWLAHLFGEPGAEEVTQLFENPKNQVIISALSLPEVFARLRAIGRQSHWSSVWETYSQLFSKVISADETIAHQAVQLRARSRERLPTMDGLIAATALVLQATLVHRDPHLKAISNPHLRQLMLPNR